MKIGSGLLLHWAIDRSLNTSRATNAYRSAHVPARAPSNKTCREVPGSRGETTSFGRLRGKCVLHVSGMVTGALSPCPGGVSLKSLCRYTRPRIVSPEHVARSLSEIPSRCSSLHPFKDREKGRKVEGRKSDIYMYRFLRASLGR